MFILIFFCLSNDVGCMIGRISIFSLIRRSYISRLQQTPVSRAGRGLVFSQILMPNWNWIFSYGFVKRIKECVFA